MAPSVDPMSPVELPAVYHPTACPRKVARNDPAIPSAIVMNIPPGSFPGMIIFAKAPATSPTMRVQTSDMIPPQWLISVEKQNQSLNRAHVSGDLIGSR